MGQTRLLAERLLLLLERLERLLPAERAPDWSALAYRWHAPQRSLLAIRPLHLPQLRDLWCIDAQKAALTRNTRQFIAGLPANNALLWGARGTGKSSLIKALLAEFGSAGLRLVEIDKAGLLDLPEIMARLTERPERFILYCDDLSFAAHEPGYAALKALLDGSLAAPGGRALIYASSNRRHLLPEPAADNQQARLIEGELHPGEAVEEQISLSERFGLWLSFHPFSQEQYLAIVAHWLARLNARQEPEERWRAEALRYALARGARSGRVAFQFACDWTGRRQLQEP